MATLFSHHIERLPKPMAAMYANNFELRNKKYKIQLRSFTSTVRGGHALIFSKSIFYNQLFNSRGKIMSYLEYFSNTFYISPGKWYGNIIYIRGFAWGYIAYKELFINYNNLFSDTHHLNTPFYSSSSNLDKLLKLSVTQCIYLLILTTVERQENACSYIPIKCDNLSLNIMLRVVIMSIWVLTFPRTGWCTTR